MKNNEYNEEEILFKKVNKMFANSPYKYWICHGTLLGIIRDKMILPWDHDIDFAVWKDEVSIKKIVKLFKQNGFKQEYIFGEMDCLHFISNTKKVDVSFYERKNGLASIKWVAPNNKVKNKILEFIANRICHPKSVEDSKNNFKNIKSIFKHFFSKFLLFIEPKISLKYKKKIYKYVEKNFFYTGYSYPLELMQFKQIKFLGDEIPVPINSKKCLCLTYGQDWVTPKKNYIWYDEAENLIRLKN